MTALIARFSYRLVLWGIVVPVAIPIVLVFLFVVVARWVIYFLAALLFMGIALGSKQYANYFWLAFFIPFFVGGLLDGIAILMADRRSDHQCSVASTSSFPG